MGSRQFFDVFVRQKVYAEYARRYLDASELERLDLGGLPLFCRVLDGAKA